MPTYHSFLETLLIPALHNTEIISMHNIWTHHDPKSTSLVILPTDKFSDSYCLNEEYITELIVLYLLILSFQDKFLTL